MRAIGMVLLGAAFGDALLHPEGSVFSFVLMIVGGGTLWYGRRVRNGARPWF